MTVQDSTMKVTVRAAHSCNPKCCFGCRCVKKIDSSKKVKPISVLDVQIREMEKTTHVFKYNIESPKSIG